MIFFNFGEMVMVIELLDEVMFEVFGEEFGYKI